VQGSDDIEVVDGSLEARRFAAAVGRNGRLVGGIAFSRPRPLMQLRRMVAERSGFGAAVESMRKDT
jgi:hypothetical protein